MRRNPWRLTCRVAVLMTVMILTNVDDCVSAEQKAQLYFFTNESCPPCRQVEPEVEKVFSLGYSVMKVDTHRHPDWTARFGVSRTPTVVLTVGDQEVARKSGYVNAAELQSWFQAVEKAQAAQAISSNAQQIEQRTASPGSQQQAKADPTQSDFEPGNAVERSALQSSVRLKIDDPEGTSYATGTVIHSRDNESLVLTCGHVFRDSNGKGAITAEYGFADDDIKVATGELLFYDADEKDIGLVAIRTEGNITPVQVAAADFPVNKGNSIFTIGCDHGERPSIRRSQVKNQAKYDGINKYEIFGRPVSGRSGGGMFTADGKLVGVCNAAVVDVDEGVYVALDTIHWQFEKVRLAHLFDGRSQRAADSQIATNADNVPVALLADVVTRPLVNSARNRELSRRDFSTIPVRDSIAQATPFDRSPELRRDGNQVTSRPVSNESGATRSEMELIVVLRDRNSSKAADSWMVANPSEALIEDLRSARSSTYPGNAEDKRMAQLRQGMPNLQPASGRTYNSKTFRAQSHR